MHIYMRPWKRTVKITQQAAASALGLATGAAAVVGSCECDGGCLVVGAGLYAIGGIWTG
jgi:hypothetical protein